MRLFLVLAMSASLLFGCGDGSQSPNTTLTVETLADFPQFDPATSTLEYILACPEDQNVEESQLRGELAFVGPRLVNGAPGFTWKATADAPPGPCAVVLRMRDSEGEVICTEYQEFVAAADAPTEVDVFMGCELTPF